MSVIHIGVVTNNKSCSGKVRCRIPGHHDGVGSQENEKWCLGNQGSDMAQAGIGSHNNIQPGTRLALWQTSEDGSFVSLGAIPRDGKGKNGGGGDYDRDVCKFDVDYAKADTPIDFKNPQADDGPNGADNEMDKPSGRYNEYAGGKHFDASNYKYAVGDAGLAPYKET